MIGNALNLLLILWLTFKFIDVSALSGTGVGTKSTLFYFTHKVPWFQIMNIEYNIGVDAISVLMMLLTSSNIHWLLISTRKPTPR